MAKLYPPYIEGSIPAFFGSELTVPYEMNKTVGYKDISGFKLKIITISTNRTIDILDDSGYNIDTKEAYFKMPVDKMVVGQFYKVQLAYKDTNGMLGFYSTIGVVKYTSQPEVSIEGLQAGNINLHQYDYVGYYQPSNQDPTEVEIYYQFDVYDYNNNLYSTTGKKIHNATIEGGDLYTLMDTFEEQKIYTIQYTVWTLNGLKVSTRKYRVMERQSLEIEVNAELSIEQNFDEGYIDITLIDKTEDEQVIEGAFIITRADSLTDFKVWNEIYRFELRNERLKTFSCRDFTPQQGVEYIYSIQQYNDNGLYSNRLLSKKIKMDFEDAFLFDGERQLRLRYNPKMNSFKNSVLEQKVNTIGNKYPFIFRNGNVSYKEFPIGGLISYLEDEENLFLQEYDIKNYHRHETPHKDSDIVDYLPTDLVSENQTKERIFKLSVLDWLTDGKPKLFRSPSEGNYIVRLLNTSLTPENALGRMIHNFTATAYEVAECNYNNLVFYNFINPNGIDKTQMKWETIELADATKNPIEFKTGKINRYPAITVEFTGMRPGDKVILDGQIIQISINGSYYASLGHPIKEIIIPEGSQYIGFMTYSFYGESVSKFNDIYNIELSEVPAQQIHGPCDVLAEIENAKYKITDFYFLRFRKEDNITIQPNDFPNNDYWVFNDDNIPENKEYIITINGNPISIKEIETYTIKDLGAVESLTIGPDIICEASYQIKDTTYNIENKNVDIIRSKNEWENKKQEYLNLLNEYSTEMKKLEDQLMAIELALLTNDKVKLLSEEEIEQLQKEIEEIKKNPYYKYLTFKEAQDYTNLDIKYTITSDKNKWSILRDPWQIEYDKILIEIELADRERNYKLKEYWEARRNELYEIMRSYLPEDAEYYFDSSNKDFSSITTFLYTKEGNYNYEIIDKVKKSNLKSYKEGEPNSGMTLGQPGFQMSLSEQNITPRPESYSYAKAYILPVKGYNKQEPTGDIIKDSMWIDNNGILTNKNAIPEIDPVLQNDNDYKDKTTIYIGVDTYYGPTDPHDMDVYVDLWIDTSDLGGELENSLQTEVDVFYYNGAAYKDIAYLDEEQVKKGNITPKDHYGWLSAVVKHYFNKINESTGEFYNLSDNPEIYVFLLNRSHYLEDETRKVIKKGYCMYQWYDYEGAKNRINILQTGIKEYLAKHDLSEEDEIEVTDWLIRNDINERNELEEYIKLCDDTASDTQTSVSPCDIFRPITLNEILDGKIYLEEEVEKVYEKQRPGKRLKISNNVPDYYYKTGNYIRLKECIDRIQELQAIKDAMRPKDELEADKEDLLARIKKYGDSLEEKRKAIDLAYNNYINTLETVLKEEEFK